MPAAHLKPVGENETDFVAVAERFLGAPYLWGGKTALGLDCSGLVQIALAACGVPCPRDSDMQEAGAWEQRCRRRSFRSRARRSRVLERPCRHRARPRTFLHANAFHMAVAIEPIADAVARIRNAGSEITSIRRIVSS